MELLNYLEVGFSVALRPENLLYCFVGVFIGTLIGVLPGIGPVGAMSLLLPSTFKATPEAAIIMLAGIYYGAMYGGSTTSILVNIPGEAASVVTCLDGYKMARQGRAGPALGMAAFGSFIAGTLVHSWADAGGPAPGQIRPPVRPAGVFHPHVLGLTILIYLAHGSMPKALIMAAFGIVLGLIGLDTISARPRFTFDMVELLDGVGLVPIVMGLFGISEVLLNIEQAIRRDVFKSDDQRTSAHGQGLEGQHGAHCPGISAGVLSGHPSRRGGSHCVLSLLRGGKEVIQTSGAIRQGSHRGSGRTGIGQQCGHRGSVHPADDAGHSPNVVMAMLLGAFMIHGVTPGPLMMKQNPELFWGVIASMYIGNVMLLILNLPLIGMWVQILKVPYKILFPLILLFCLIGVYSVNNSVFDIYIMLIFGILGYLMKKFEYEGAP